MVPHSDLTLAALIRELEIANHRADEAERFTMNFTALAPFARPDELPPLARFVRAPRTSTRQSSRQPARTSARPPMRRLAQLQRHWAPPEPVPHPRFPGDQE